MASGRRRRPGSGSWVYKPNKKHPKRIEARFPIPVWAFSKWPGVLPKDGLVKLFPIGFETEATKWLDDNYRAAVQGTWEPPKVSENKGKASRITFAEYATDYVETRVKANGDPIEETTKEKYRQYLRDHLLPVLGVKAMGDVTDDDIDRWAASMKVGKAGEGAVVRRRVFELLRGIFNEACERPLDASGQTLLKHNPVRHLRIDRPDSKREYVDVSMEELAAIHDAMPPRLALVIYLCGQLALRPGEALALERHDIELRDDDGSGVLHVTKNAKEIIKDGHKIVVAGKTKTKGSVRDEQIPAWMVPYVRHHLETYVEDRPSALLFTGERSRDYVKSQTLRNAYYRARKAVPRVDALEPPLYNLRHRALTKTATYTKSLRAIMAQGGHTRASTAMHYQHTTDGETAKILAGMNAEAEAAGLTGKTSQASTGTEQQEPAKRADTAATASKSPGASPQSAGAGTAAPSASAEIRSLSATLANMPCDVRITVLRNLDEAKRSQVLACFTPAIQAETMIRLLSEVA